MASLSRHNNLLVKQIGRNGTRLAETPAKTINIIENAFTFLLNIDENLERMLLIKNSRSGGFKR